MFDQPIPWKNEVRYLGISFDNHLRFNNQVERAKTRGQMVRGQLNSLVNRRSKMFIKNEITIYRTMIRPSIMYGSATPQLQKLQVVQNKFLRAAFKAPLFVRNTQLHREANFPTIKEFLQDDARKFYAKAAVHPNPLVRESVNYDENAPQRHKRQKYLLPRVEVRIGQRTFQAILDSGASANFVSGRIFQVEDRRNFRKDRRHPPHRRSVLRECAIPCRQRAKRSSSDTNGCGGRVHDRAGTRRTTYWNQRQPEASGTCRIEDEVRHEFSSSCAREFLGVLREFAGVLNDETVTGTVRAVSHTIRLVRNEPFRIRTTYQRTKSAPCFSAFEICSRRA
jgi:hypothetical protein